MRLIATVLLALAGAAVGFAQFTETANHNAYTTKQAWTGPDTTMPYRNDQGVRTVWVANDLDGDQKPELLTTDYSNGGRVHVFELSAPGTLELVWSSPKVYDTNPNSTPRWVVTGDMDDDGMQEIVFPVGGRYTGEVHVYEYDGTDNGYGTAPALTLPSNLFTTSGAGSVRMDRERGTLYDCDGDGRDELITAFSDNKTYIIGVVGDIGGFGSWQLEGGDPAVNPENGFSGGSWWHSFPADIDGDGTKEIVNHYWNFYGFWSIDPLGSDSYRYPTPGADSATVPAAKTAFYHEYTHPWGDACSYMGIVPLDVDGDNKEELAGVIYTGGSTIEYFPVLASLSTSDTGVYVWRDTTQFGIIGSNLWELAGYDAGSHWGTGAYDFNGNGRDEYLLGGSALYNVISLEYKGTGSILDEANYDKTIVFPGDVALFHEIDYRDSLGAKSDTVRRESPFVAKMFVPADLDGDGDMEIVLSYQSVADSITYQRFIWDTTAVPNGYVLDTTWKAVNTNAVNIRVAEYTGGTFVARDLRFVTPDDYVLEQNYPNPFNPSTTIRFVLPVNKKISLTVYDITGREVRTLISGQDMQEGPHELSWDGRDNNGTPVASGQYVYTLRYGSFSKSQKMTLLK